MRKGGVVKNFLMFCGAFLIWVVACFFITGCVSDGGGAAYRETIGSVKVRKETVFKELEAGKIDVKTALALIKDLDDLKDRARKESKGDGRRLLIELGIIAAGIFGGSRYRDKIPGMTRPGYVHKING